MDFDAYEVIEKNIERFKLRDIYNGVYAIQFKVSEDKELSDKCNELLKLIEEKEKQLQVFSNICQVLANKIG